MKTMTKYGCLIGLLLLSGLTCYAAEKTIKVACVGNSITYGSGLKNQLRDGYPGVLGQMLGADYEVRNYGYGGRTMLNKGNLPYMNEAMYQEALAFCPDIVTIKLGTNDTKPINWKYKEDFPKDMTTMIRAFQALPSQPEIYLCYPVPAYRTDWGINDSIISTEVQAYIREVAGQTGVHIIDLYTPFSNKPEWFVDKIHPNERGAFELAKIFYRELTGKEAPADFEPQNYPGVKSVKDGNVCYSFNHRERRIEMRVPIQVVEVAPWVWIPMSSEENCLLEKALLEEGCYVLSGEPSRFSAKSDSIKDGSSFYKYMTKYYGLSSKVILAGRGSAVPYLCAWALAFPDKVACLYIDALKDAGTLEALAAANVPVVLEKSKESKLQMKSYKGRMKILPALTRKNMNTTVELLLSFIAE